MRNNHRGFTIIELIIASTIFAIILLVVAAGITAIGRLYFKNETSARVQESARATIDDVAKTVQFGNPSIKKIGDPGAPNPIEINAQNETSPKTICIGETRYTYVLNRKVGNDPADTKHALWVDKLPNSSCSKKANLDAPNPSEGTDADTTSSGKELLGEGMRLLDFDVTEQNTVVRVNIRIGYGTNDLFTHYELDGMTLKDLNSNGAGDIKDFRDTQCRSTVNGGAFCAVSELDTKVKRRIN